MEIMRIEDSASGKTRQWLIYAEGGGQLGRVGWYAPWRCYAFFPRDRTIFERVCLREIANFCEEQTNAHRSALRAPRRTAVNA